MKHIGLTLLLALSILAAPSIVQASGSAPGQIVKPKQSTGQTNPMDDAKYALGQQVYAGTAPRASSMGSASSQKARLMKLAGVVTDSAKAKSLPSLAGKLSDAQLSALEYFVSTRFAH